MTFFEIGKVEHYYIVLIYVLVENISFWAHAELQLTARFKNSHRNHITDTETYSFCRQFSLFDLILALSVIPVQLSTQIIF